MGLGVSKAAAWLGSVETRRLGNRERWAESRAPWVSPGGSFPALLSAFRGGGTRQPEAARGGEGCFVPGFSAALLPEEEPIPDFLGRAHKRWVGLCWGGNGGGPLVCLGLLLAGCGQKQ